MWWLLLAVAAVALGAAVGWRLGARRVSAEVPVATTARAESTSFVDALEEHPVGVVVVDGRGEIAFRNRAALRLQGTHVGVLVDEAIERHGAAARAGLAGDDVLELYGPPRTVLVIEARPLPDRGAVVFVEDISERRRIDQIRTDFVTNISHELKTPIGALSVLAETLEDEPDPETRQRLVARMLSEAERATRVVDDLMELSRIELGGERTRESVRVADVVAAAIGRVTELAAQRDIGISSLGAVERAGVSGDAVTVVGDRRQLVSAVGNLVENAVKYSESGSTVQVRTRRDGAVVEIAVSDTGVGIPQRDLDRIFERFYRVDRARSRATGGTGLGLSIVRHVATNHDGEVLVTSTEGEGSTFRLRLPLGTAERTGDPTRNAVHDPDEEIA